LQDYLLLQKREKEREREREREILLEAHICVVAK
jgi:hypothetical protein